VELFVSGVVATTDVVEACTGVNIAVMVGGFPRKEGMERKDVMSKNVSIYKSQASALEKHAAANCKVINSIINNSCFCNFLICIHKLIFNFVILI
jgi:malate dehydrogenase